MKQPKTADTTELIKLLTALSHPRKLQLVLYLRTAGIATNAVLSKNLGYSKSSVSKHVKSLVGAGLLKKEKIFSTTIFKLNQQRLHQVREMLALL